MDSYITSIGTANPGDKIPQKIIAQFMAKAHKVVDGEKGRLHALYRATGIEYRYSVIEDYASPSNFSFFPATDDLEPFPSTSRRMQVYKAQAIELSLQAAKNCLESVQINHEDVTHLITVSCTGMYAPGLDIELVHRLGLPYHVKRTAINYMGCYAAFNALNVADSLCKTDAAAKVLVVCTELCSIHFQKTKLDDNLLANAIFGDGSAAMLVEPRTSGLGLKICSSLSDILPEGEKEMAWEIEDFGFQMKLSTYVPDVIKKGIKQLTQNILEETGISQDEISYYAIHPGGKKILEEIEKELNIPRAKNQFAFKVLREFGNMSSPTILFVLKEIWNDLTSEDIGKNILCFAFGPGLTLEGMLLKIAKQDVV